MLGIDRRSVQNFDWTLLALIAMLVTTRLRELARPGLIIALPVGLILGQHDMGVALLTLLIGGTYLFLVRIPFRAWLAVAIAGAAALAALWTFTLAPYQKERILTVID